jgi:prepilin-type processing-associated H-X9-DG protein
MCPSGAQSVITAANGKDGMWEVNTPTWSTKAQGHYGINSNFVTTPPKSLAEVQLAAETALAFDCTLMDASDLTVTFPNPILDGSRHFDGINVLYADGHVKFTSLAKTYTA